MDFHLLFFCVAALKLNDPKVCLPDVIHTQICFQLLMYREETTQVNGSMMIGDQTDATIKHMFRFPIEDMKNFMKSFQVGF